MLISGTFTTWDLIVAVIGAVLGASGWGAAAMKMILDIREEKRKAREDQRKDAAEERANYEAMVKRAEGLAPFITELSRGEHLYRWERIDKLAKNPALEISPEEGKELRSYPAQLEKLGALMLAGKFPPEYIHQHFGEEILTTKNAIQLWKGEDMHYWKVFMLLAESMEQVRSHHRLHPKR